MFFSTDILRSRRSALGALWSAAFAKNLRRRSVLSINVASSCDAVLDPEVPQALRLQAILTTGIVKVHEKKVSYLHQDAEGAVQRLHRLADASEPDEQAVTNRETKKRKPKITQEKRQPSEQAPDLAMSFDALDVEYLTGHGGLQSLEDQDYFVVQFHQGSGGNDYGYGCDGSDGYDYMMESPPEFLQDLEEAIIPRAGSSGHGYDGYDAYGYDDYAPNDANVGEGQNGPPPATREQIVVRQRKRRRALCVDEELVDPDMLSMNASQQQQHQEKQARDDILLREALVMRTPEARECRLVLASFPAVTLLLEGPSVHEAGHDLANILGEMFIRRAKRGKRGGGQTAAGRVRDPDGADGLVGDDAAARRAQQDLGQDFYDGNETEQGVELEQLRTALHLTPQNQNPSLRFGPGGHSSNPASSMPGSVRSSVDLSREDSGLSNSVQKKKLSDLLIESQYELQNGAGPDSGRRRSGRSGRRDVQTWSQLERFKLQETGPSEPQDKMDELATGGSHTLDILTKAMLCCRSWGALPVDPARGEDDENGAGVEFIDRMSLDDVTRHLSRQEAARFFHHVLVGVTTGMVTAIQRGAYEPILIHFN